MNLKKLMSATALFGILLMVGVVAGGSSLTSICGVGLYSDWCTSTCQEGNDVCRGNCPPGDTTCLGNCDDQLSNCLDLCFCIDACDRALIWCNYDCELAGGDEHCYGMCQLEHEICFWDNCF